MADWLSSFDAFAWITANIVVAYIAFVLVVFVISYYVLFDPNATTGGKLIFRFSLSLVGVIILTYLSLYVNPAQGRDWFVYPPDVFWWRPLVRLAVYLYVAFTITSLCIFLAIRKWRPETIKTAPDRHLVNPRRDHTEKID